jgi:16S rRNA (guanine527-N7)-methyltransferase
MKTPTQHRVSFNEPELDATAQKQLEAYLALLLLWNARINLTAVREPDEIVRRHFAESIYAAEHIPKKVKTLLDYGSGAGFPGIPIAICRPEIGVTLAESQQKKAAFLREAVRTLALKADVFPGRVEAMEPARVFDAVTLRAVDKMTEACQTAVQRLAVGGWIGIFTTRKTEELIEKKVKGIRWDEPRVEIPGSDQEILKTGRRL